MPVVLDPLIAQTGKASRIIRLSPWFMTERPQQSCPSIVDFGSTFDDFFALSRYGPLFILNYLPVNIAVGLPAVCEVSCTPKLMESCCWGRQASISYRYVVVPMVG